ncbi:Vinculin [Exaiptasia diaphana]|nr:Vinculin [Exaiptasia diaphana]
MPVFHTKTIESILDPVAQQVSQLVIFHEEGEDGRAMPDLSMPIKAVGAAVANLVKVGQQTAANSKDKILRQEMPLAFNRVEESSTFLVEASHILKDDPFSSVARKKLIDGARGILSGTSALLLTLDEAEVRKILRVCKGLLEYFPVAEMVDEMADLRTFVTNLTPGITSLAKQVEERAEELTHHEHRDILKTCIGKVKHLVPLLISAMKTFVKSPMGAGRPEAQENRNFIITKICSEITEIMRVLQLTSAEENKGDDPLYDMKKAVSVFDSKFDRAKDWIGDATCDASGLGEKAVRECIQQGRTMANVCQDPHKTMIQKCCDDLDKLMEELASLRSQGKGTTPRGLEISREVGRELNNLRTIMDDAVQHQGISGVKKPATSFAGKMEQAQQWLQNPSGDHTGIGERAIRQCIQDARNVAEKCSGPERMELLKLCNELENLTNELSELKRRGLGNSPQARALAGKIANKLDELHRKTQRAIANQLIEACEEAINRDVLACDTALTQENPQMVVAKTSNIARMAKRIGKIVSAEAENTEDPELRMKLETMSRNVQDLISPLAIEAKSVVSNIKDRQGHGRLRAAMRRLQNNVSDIRKVFIDRASQSEEDDFPPPPPPPPPQMEDLSLSERAPPRPPLPREETTQAPPRPPPPVIEPAVDMNVQNMLECPPEDNRIAMAASNLHKEILKWEEQGNDMIQAAKKMAILFAKMSKYMRDEEEGQPHSKKELIELAKEIANASKEIVKLGHKAFDKCNDKRLKSNMQQTIDRIPTISTQLKIVSTVKATMIGSQELEEDREATETLVGCAENLMSAVRQTVRETEAASVKMRTDAGLVMHWRKKH